MNVTNMQKKADKLYKHLDEAYELAGCLRDDFTGVVKNEAELKDYCNTIREKIYEIRELKGLFKARINTLK